MRLFYDVQGTMGSARWLALLPGFDRSGLPRAFGVSAGAVALFRGLWSRHGNPLPVRFQHRFIIGARAKRIFSPTGLANTSYLPFRLALGVCLKPEFEQ